MFNKVVFPSTKSSSFMQHKLAAVFRASVLFFIAFSIALMSLNAHAAQVKVTFDPSPDSRASGHNIYYCQSQNFSKTNYSEKIDLGNDTAYVVSNLQEGTTYYFAATAYDKYGNESVFSEVLSFKVPEKDSDGDGTPDRLDNCPNDPFKVDPGSCGCGLTDKDSDGDGTPDCFDECPNDPFKVNPGICGCGIPESDSNCNNNNQKDMNDLISLLSAPFESNSDGFIYTDDTFRNTNLPSYASGSYAASDGYNGGGLQVTLGGVDNTSRKGMSGGWSKSFSLPSEATVSISLLFKMNHIADSDECGEVLVAVDGVLLGEHLERLCGVGTSKPVLDTGWKQADFELVLPEGEHTITVGGYLNKKTYHNEFTTIYFDEIFITTDNTVLPEYETGCNDGIDNDGDGLIDCNDPDCGNDSACDVSPVSPVPPSTDFDGSSDGFTYADDTFRNTNLPSYASGNYAASGDYNEGTLQVTLGGVDNTSRKGMSGGWSKSFSLPSETTVSISLWFKMTHIADSDECGEVLVAVDGVLLGEHLERLCGVGTSKPALDTGWKQADFELVLPEGAHTITVGGYLNKKTYHNEFTTIYFDEIVISNSYLNVIEDFENYVAGNNPSDWFDTKAANSMIEDNSLFKVFNIDNNYAFGTTSTLTNIHSHHIKAYIENLTSFEYTGRMMMTDPNGGIGVTFLSHYPFTDTYYRLRCTRDDLSFHLAPHPHKTAAVFGTTDTGVIPKANVWYQFRIRVQNTGLQTEILAKVWPENASEPVQWQIDAYDNTPNRLVSGTFGVWSGHAGAKYWDDLTLSVLD